MNKRNHCLLWPNNSVKWNILILVYPDISIGLTYLEIIHLHMKSIQLYRMTSEFCVGLLKGFFFSADKPFLIGRGPMAMRVPCEVWDDCSYVLDQGS